MITAKNGRCLVAAAALALSGCGALPIGGNVSTETRTSETSLSGDVAAKAKLSAYTQGFNKLLDTFGLAETKEHYFKENIPDQSPADSISISDGWLEQGATLLRTARAMRGGTADVDAAADTLIGALDAVIKRLEGLEVYYDSKAYRNDGLRRGKAEDPVMRAEFDKATAALAAFDVLLDRERKVAVVAELAALKAANNMLGYNTKLALQQAEGVIDLFDKDDDVRDSAVFTRADAQVSVLEKTLADLRVEIAKAKGRNADRPFDVNYELVADRLTSQIGDYRDLKQSKDVDDFNDMIKNYNGAIDDSNDIDT